MASFVEDCLHTLHNLLRQPPSSSKEQIEDIIDDIKASFLDDITGKELDLTCSLLFDKDKGIIHFLRETAAKDELQNGKEKALHLISIAIEKVDKKILPFSSDIKEISVSVYKRDRFAKVKNAAILLLEKILKVAAGSSHAEDLRVKALIPMFFTDLSKASQIHATVQASIYNLLGVIAEAYHDVMVEYSERLVGLYVTALKTEANEKQMMTSTTREPKLPIVAGCLGGLTGFMLNFTQSEDSKHSYEIFKYVRMAINPEIEYTRFDVPKAGLNLIAKHAEQFRPYLLDNYQEMYKKLESWSKHHNRDVLHLGLAALTSFLREICAALVEKAQDGVTEDIIFKFFLIKFRNIMEDKDATPKHVSMAVTGYGMLAAPCRSFLSEADTQFMLSEVVSMCEHQFFSSSSDIEEHSLSLPNYMKALANIIRQLDSISVSYCAILERLLILLLEKFPSITKPQQYFYTTAWLRLMLTLAEKATVFQTILSATVYQGLIRTCSHPTSYESTQTQTNQPDVMQTEYGRQISYKDFVPFWRGLLESIGFKELAQEDFTVADRQNLVEALYNEIIASVLKILSKLDLNAKDQQESGEEEGLEDPLLKMTSADPTFGIAAEKPMDFLVLINMVDLCRDLLMESHCDLFHLWVYTFFQSLIVLATRNPVVSGLYKLLTVAVTVARKTNYFKDFGEYRFTSEESEESSQGARYDEKILARELIRRFSKEVLMRMKQYRDDLLASCLTLILAMPKEIISDLMADVIPAIQTTFAIGLSYLPLALVGLEALESWKENLPNLLLEPYYAEILPCLDPYLQADENGSGEASVDSTVSVVSKKTNQKVSLKILKEKKAVEKLSESLLSKVKRRILHYLGSLGGGINHHLLAHTDDVVSEEAIAWDSQKQHLRFDVPFFDMKPTIYFDPFLPRVIYLAQTSSDRPTKVAACELLHSLILYAVGHGAQMSGETQQRKPMERLYQKLFPPLLSLACDVEQVCKDLFKPLAMQLIHWFTNNKMAESPETMALLNAIYDGLIQQSDMALRDFCARCLKEFLQWSLKQISKKSARTHPINAKSVMKRMFSFSLHPNVSKRLGAALAFNNIYMVFREENDLVNRFTFEILTHFVESLAMAHKDPKYSGTQEQCNNALLHLERIIIVKADLLKKDPGHKLRPEPSSWSSRTLENAVRWLTRQCGRPETECRHTCMKLVYDLSTYLPGMKSPSDYFNVLFNYGGAKYFIERFEGGSNGSKGLLKNPTLSTDHASVSKLMEWMDNLLAALDCYWWIFGQELLTPLKIFIGKGSELSCVFQSLKFFLDNVALNGMEDLGIFWSQSSEVIIRTPLEIEEFNRGKCTVIIRLWNFLTILLKKYAGSINKFVPANIWCENLWILTADCIVRPHFVGFDMADTETISMLPGEMNKALEVMGRYLPNEHKKKFVSCAEHQLIASDDRNLEIILPTIDFTDDQSDNAHLTYMVHGYKQLQEHSYLANSVPGLKDSQRFVKDLLDTVFNGIVQDEDGCKKIAKLSPTSKALANSLLALAFQLEVASDTLISLLLDKSKILGSWQKTGISHGDWFFSCLRPTILDHVVGAKKDEIGKLCAVLHTDSERVSAILVAILDHVGRDRTLRKREGIKVCNAVLSKWAMLNVLWGDGCTLQTQKLAFGILTKILLIDNQVASKETHQYFPPVFEMYLCLLTSRKTPLNFKNEILALMPFFASVTKDNKERLRNALNQFVADSFPLKSSEFTPGTNNYNDYISAIDKFLVAMEMTGSLVLLELIISIICKEQQHCHETPIQDRIRRFIHRLPSASQKPAMDVAYNIFTREEYYASDIRRVAVEKVCLHMLQLATTAAVIEFFSDHIEGLMSHLDGKMKSTESALEVQLTNRIGAFQLLERMYSRLYKDEVNSKSSTINMKYCQGKAETGKEMTQKITKTAQEAKSEDVRGEKTLLELRRQYHCHAYNLMITIVSCVQTDMKFYKGFLFQENLAKGQFLLDNIICQEKSYEFSAEFQAPLEQREKYISLRKEVKEQQLMDGVKVEGTELVTPSLHLASQYLADSSLSDDLSQYDFNQHASGQSMSGTYSRKNSTKASTSDSGARDSKDTANSLVLEMDALNQHECMAPLVGLLQHMESTGISPPVAKGDIPKEMPAWMTYLHDKMSQASAHINCKLFIAKLIINCSKIFQPYAKFWFLPLFELIFTSHLASQRIHYFLVDLIVTMLSWQSIAIPQERSMVSRLVRQLVCGIHHPNRQVFRNNLELLKTLLDCWNPQVDIPYKDIWNYLNNTDRDSTQYVTGLQVLGLVVSNKFAAYGPSASVGQDRYFDVLCKRMSHRLKPVYAASAEVLGMVLYRAGQEDKLLEETLLNQVVNQLSSMAPERGDNFIICVHKIHNSYPSIAKRLVSKLLFILPNLHGELKSKCLEVIQSHVGELENAYVELIGKGLTDFLSHRDEMTQLVSLRIVQDMMVKLDKKQLNSLINMVVAFASHPSLSCRKVMLDILMWVFDNYRHDEDETSMKIMMVTKETLLKGLCDKELECRLICQNFWSSNTRLSEGTLDRMVTLLEAMYSSSTENHFLSYATNLLLESTSKSPDYERLIFEHPLSECTFQEYAVQSSWHQRHATMTPLFAVTMSSQSPMDGWSPDDSMDGGDVRATMDTRQFTATMDVSGSGKAYNWLTQSSLDTYTDVVSSGPESQMLFTLGSEGVSPRSKIKGDTEHSAKKTFALKNVKGQESASPQAAADTSSKFSDVWRLKRRFLKDKETSYYSKRQIRLKKLQETVRQEQKARRENEVTLYRKYRIGDLPDVQIKYQYIIAPLQALAHKDNKIASLLFSSLFKAVFAQKDTVKTEREAEEVVNQVKKSMENILSQTDQYFPPFITSIMDILYELRSSVQVSPNDMATCAIFSGQQNLGILILEEQLIGTDDIQAPSSKRARTSQRTAVSPDIAKWIELCRLYKSVHEYDAVQGILSDRLGTKEFTRNAIEAEARGDYKTARQFYEKAISCTDWQDEDPLECEMDFWDDGRMECLNYLCQWQDLETVSVTGVDSSDTANLERVWDDPFYQEHYLPYVIRSKLKLLVAGNEGQQPLLSFVDQAMTNTARRQHLQSRYSMDIALMSLWQKDYNKARHFTSLSFDKFLQDWMSITPMMAQSREDNLCHLQTLVEMHEFLNAITNEGTSVRWLCDQWRGRTPHSLVNPIPTWDDIATNRSVYLDLLSQGQSSQPSTSYDDSMSLEPEIDGMMEELQTNLWLDMADSCRRKNNLALTLKLLKKTNSTFKKSRQDCASRWTMIYAETHHTKALAAHHPWPGEMFNNVMTTVDQLVKLEGSARPDYKVWTHLLIGQAFDTLTSGLMGLDDLDSLEKEVLSKLYSHLSCKGGRQQLIKQAVQKGYESLMKGTQLEVVLPQGTQAVIGLEQANLDVAKYCDKYLRLQEERKISDDQNMRTFPTTIVNCLLSAIKGGSLEARERFPCLLQLAGQFTDVHDIFVEKVEKIPCWMFLMWLSQMTAVMDKPEGVVVIPVLERIANEYPQALVYPFYMSYEDLQFGDSPEDRKNKQKIDSISKTMAEIPIINKFISALEQFSQPLMLFKDWTEEMKKLLKVKNKDEKKIKQCYNRIYASLIQDKNQVSSSSEDTQSSLSIISVNMGEYRKVFSNIFKNQFDQMFGKDGDKLIGMSLNEFANAVTQLTTHSQDQGKKLSAPSKLKEYSPWMADFTLSKYGKTLEIPGQYSGLKKPLPEYHVYVAGFAEIVLVLNSLRQPKKIIIRGNDEKDHPYLVKGGEDLRLDQRIQNLFYIMNQVMRTDPACCQRKLQLITYQVIPMNPRLGLIQWLNNTCVLKDFYMNALEEDEKKSVESSKGAPQQQHLVWTGKAAPGETNPQKIYDAVYLKYNSAETTREFRSKEAKLPWDLSRRALKKMSTSAAAFHVLRNRLVTSHATVCICHYLLGIGDRHLCNFMINTKTGHMIGIDFGHAFGTATQFLPVPELIPFRLTPQLLNLTMPLKAKGQMEGTMRHVLRAMRKDSDLLFSTMDVFVKEPSMDWLMFAERQVKQLGLSQESVEKTWYPRQKIEIAKRKLEGDHPSYIMRDELQSSSLSKRTACKKYMEVLMGSNEQVRSQLSPKTLTVEDQVAALINQATDPNILGRVWVGWIAWM